MRNHRSSRLGVAALAVCGVLAAFALVPPLLAKDMVPYRGAGWGTPLELNVEWPSEENPSGRATGILAEFGEATHFGEYHALVGVDGYFVWEDDVLVLIWTGAFYQEAADGSSVIGHLVGREPLIDTPTPFTMAITIVGGTGRFEGATGYWEVSALAAGDYTYTAEGWISSVGSTRSRR